MRSLIQNISLNKNISSYNIYTNIIPRKILFKFKFIFPFHGICRYTRIMNKSIIFAMVTFILLSTLICQSHQVEVKKTNFYNFSFFFTTFTPFVIIYKVLYSIIFFLKLKSKIQKHQIFHTTKKYILFIVYNYSLSNYSIINWRAGTAYHTTTVKKINVLQTETIFVRTCSLLESKIFYWMHSRRESMYS